MNRTVADIGEFGLIRRIHDLLDKEGVKIQELELGIGDDCASFRPRKDMELLVTCDSMVEGRHYLTQYISPHDLGRRAMVMNISDIGAMGGYPLYALISLGLRSETPVKDIDNLYMGFMEELKPFGAGIIGGNITKTDHSVFIDITLIGEVEKEFIMRRSTAVEGDSILVTGYPGQAAEGLKMLINNPERENLKDHPLVKAFNRPCHRAKEGRAIARSGYASAMIDTSDGLLGDLGHICEQSGVGAEIFHENLPVSEHMREFDNVREIVMGESDDYELIITCPSENTQRIRDLIASISSIPISDVGRITNASEGISLVLSNGAKRELQINGWDHFKG